MPLTFANMCHTDTYNGIFGEWEFNTNIHIFVLFKYCDKYFICSFSYLTDMYYICIVNSS